MNSTSFDQPEDGEDLVKKIRVGEYQHHEGGLDLLLKDMDLYLLNPEDFAISPAQFDPAKHEHSIPRAEMARIYILLCALTQDSLGLGPDDRHDPVFQIYEKAYNRCLAVESDPGLIGRLTMLADDCGFIRHPS